MKTKLIMILSGLVLLLTPAQAAFRDLLINYINAQNAVTVILGNVKNENDAKAGAAAIDAAVTALQGTRAQLQAAGSTPAAEKDAAVKEKGADMQKASAALAEQLSRVRKNKGISQILAATLAKLT